MEVMKLSKYIEELVTEEMDKDANDADWTIFHFHFTFKAKKSKTNPEQVEMQDLTFDLHKNQVN